MGSEGQMGQVGGGDSAGYMAGDTPLEGGESPGKPLLGLGHPGGLWL